MKRRPNLIYVENGYATLTVVNEFGHSPEITTTRLARDRYVRIDDGRQYPQLCAGGYRTGATLSYYGDAQLARDCNAELYKTKNGYKRARARIVDDEWHDVLLEKYQDSAR